MQQARSILVPTTYGYYMHVPVLPFNRLAQVRQRLEAKPAQAATPVRLTQEQQVERLRKRGWRIKDNMVHPFFAGQKAKVVVHAKEGTVRVVHPLGTVYEKADAERAGWYSPAERERARLNANNRMPIGQRRVPAQMDVGAQTQALLKAFAVRGHK